MGRTWEYFLLFCASLALIMASYSLATGSWWAMVQAGVALAVAWWLDHQVHKEDS